MRSQKDLGGVFYGVRGSSDEVVANSDATVCELPCQLLAFKEWLRIDNNDREWDARLVSMYYGLFNNRRGCINQNYVACLDFSSCQVADESVRSCDTLANEDVNLLNQIALGLVLRGRWIYFDNDCE